MRWNIYRGAMKPQFNDTYLSSGRKKLQKSVYRNNDKWFDEPEIPANTEISAEAAPPPARGCLSTLGFQISDKPARRAGLLGKFEIKYIRPRDARQNQGQYVFA